MYTHIHFLAVSAGNLGTMTLQPQGARLVPFYNKRNQFSSETLRLGQAVCKMSLEHLKVPESKKVLKTKTKRSWSVSKGCRNQPKELPTAKAGTI